MHEIAIHYVSVNIHLLLWYADPSAFYTARSFYSWSSTWKPFPPLHALLGPALKLKLHWPMIMNRDVQIRKAEAVRCSTAMQIIRLLPFNNNSHGREHDCERYADNIVTRRILSPASDGNLNRIQQM